MAASEITISATIDGWALDIKRASVTLDDTWTQYAQASLTIASPSGALLETIDPRKGKRVLITVTQSWGRPFTPTVAFFSTLLGGRKLSEIPDLITPKTLAGLSALADPDFETDYVAPVTRTFDLSLRSRVINHLSGELELRLASDEAFLDSISFVNDTPYTNASNKVRYIAQETITYAGLTTYIQPGAANASVPDDAHTLQPGQQLNDFLQPILQATGLRLWCDEKRVWRLDPAEKNRTDSITLSYLDTIKDASDQIELADLWFDAVVVVYKWTDAAKVQQQRVDFAQFNPLPVNTRTITYDDTVYPGPGAAGRILNRASGRGRMLSVKAVTDFRATPGMQARVDLPDTPSQSGYISAVTWSFPEAEMSVTTRGLTDAHPTAWVFAPAGLSWTEIPAGTTWATFDPTDFYPDPD